eukprot:2772060-Alexandrium_andersonii.AAC.1
MLECTRSLTALWCAAQARPCGTSRSPPSALRPRRPALPRRGAPSARPVGLARGSSSSSSSSSS